MIALGLLILAAAGVTAAAGFLANDGASNALSQPFEVFGYNFTDSSGRLFVFGIIVGVVAMLGIALMLKGMRRRVRHSVDSRRERRTIRGEADTLAAERDQLAQELEEERARKAALEPASAADTRIVAADTAFLQAERPDAPVTERVVGAAAPVQPVGARPAEPAADASTDSATPTSGWSTPPVDSTETDRDPAITGGRPKA